METLPLAAVENIMKMRVLFVAVMVLILGRPGSRLGLADDNKDLEARYKVSNYFARIEVEGTLEVQKNIRTNWNDAWSSTGVCIRGPEAADHVGPVWDLFLSDDKALHELARKLAGKNVVAGGTLYLLHAPHVSGPGGRDHWVVKVTRLRPFDPDLEYPSSHKATDR